MAELSSLTYSINVSDEVLSFIKEEIAALRATLLVQEAKLECQAEKFGKELGEHIAVKYKEMLAEQEPSTEKAQDAEGLLKKFTSLISETSLGQNVCCGISAGEVASTSLITSCGYVVNTKGHIPHDAVGPFVIEGESVYISKALIKDVTVEPQPFIVVNGETYISSTRMTELGVTFQGGKDTNGSVVVQSDDYSSTQGWKFDNSNGDLELNSNTTKIKKTGDVVSVFDKLGTLRTRVQL